MSAIPFSIHVRQRPVRTAYLVANAPESMEIIDVAITDSQRHWGGRYNVIIPTDGQSLAEDSWVTLAAADPDVVKSTVPLGSTLVSEIERKLCPLLIQEIGVASQVAWSSQVRLGLDGIHILPTPQNVRKVGWGHVSEQLAIVEVDRAADPCVKRFVELNIGVVASPVVVDADHLEGVGVARRYVTSTRSLASALTALSSLPACTYPVQLCSLPNWAVPPMELESRGHGFLVVIGDSPADAALFWNRPISAPEWARSQVRQVWLPVRLATDAELKEAMSTWLRVLASRGGDQQASVCFASASLSKEELKDVSTSLATKLCWPWEARAASELHVPSLKTAYLDRPDLALTNFHRVTSTVAPVMLQEPDISSESSAGAHWMADLFIEFRPELYPMILGRPLWWRLPRRNLLAASICGPVSRVLRTGFPSVRMSIGSPRLDIELPEDIEVVARLVVSDDHPCFTADVRHVRGLRRRTPYYETRRSDKGRYLSGILELFGGLYQASCVFEDRYWRRMFDLLSGRTAEKDAAKLREVENALRKEIGSGHDGSTSASMDVSWLASYVLKLARSLPASSQDRTFQEFEAEAVRELGEFNARSGEANTREYSQDDLKQAIGEQIRTGVLQIGIRVRCVACGYNSWRHINDARQSFRCRGCGADSPLLPEPDWCYRLNSLVEAAHRDHGLTPVVLVLGQLLLEAKSSFLFVPCLDLFEEVGAGPVGDVDIAAIVDGQFVIGEVKQSGKRFGKADFRKMEEIASRLLPDTLLFASMDREAPKLVSSEIERLSKTLGMRGVAVKWYPLHGYKYEATPIL